MKSILIALGLLMGQANVDTGLKCSGVQAGLKTFISHQLKAYGGWPSRHRVGISSKLSRRIVAEAKRFDLDPLVMASIAWVESSYNPHTRGVYGGRGNWKNEVGIWQVMPGDGPVVTATRDILGCKPVGKAAHWYSWRWERKYKGKVCLYPDVAKHRKYVGRLRRSEMQDVYVGTWLAAHELRQHIDTARTRWKRYRWPMTSWWSRWLKRNPTTNHLALARYLHYNWGSRVLKHNNYRRRLFTRYSKLRDEVCGVE